MDQLFRTPVKTPEYGFRIDHTWSGFSIGSCFAEKIYERLRRNKFRIVCNPMGAMYNPLSIADSLTMLASERVFTRDDLTLREDLWFSFAHHGNFSGKDPDQVLGNINLSMKAGAKALRQADYVIVTFGTAWAYSLVETGETVANCHKLPAAAFARRRISVDEIVALFDDMLRNSALAGKKVIFTVSPIRHLKDGLPENNLSKATLFLAIHQLIENNENAFYFPAFEIMNDDLRDYRFYEDDMVHPSEKAIDYVWNIFRNSVAGRSTRELMTEIKMIVEAAGHRPIHSDTAEHKRFLETMYHKTHALQLKYPYLDLMEELSLFRQ